ncbi:MAG: MFS transporter [Elusimicrobia bacterium]|nr:MFS transporter [Elusimicrobiota bacterium]
MRKALDTAALGFAGLCLGLAAGALPAAASAEARLELSKSQLALTLGLGLWTRALASGFAGALVDRFGVRRALRGAAAGAAAAGLGLGLLFLGGREETAFVGVAILHAALCYFLAFAGPAAARMNAARLEPALRGRHSGLYGAIAFPAEFLALPAGLWLGGRLPAAAFVLLPAGAALLALAAALLAPRGTREDEPHPRLAELAVLARRRDVLLPASLEACAGAARWGLLGWSAQFLNEVHHVRLGTPLFGAALAAAAGGAFLGPVLAGLASDKGFGGRRGPAAAVFFAALTGALIGLGRALEPVTAVAFLGAACAASFGVHALLSGAAAMDAGGRRSAGAVSGLLDGVHHAAGGLAMLLVGAMIDRGGWAAWTRALIPFAVAGAGLSFLLGAFKAEAPDPCP